MREIKDVFDYTIEHHGISTVVQIVNFNVKKLLPQNESYIYGEVIGIIHTIRSERQL